MTHYLNAAAALGVDKAKASGRAVVEQMKSMPVKDDFYQGQIRADGKFVHNMYVWQVKTPAESTGPWDFFKLRHTIPRGPGLPARRGKRLSPGQGLDPFGRAVSRA